MSCEKGKEQERQAKNLLRPRFYVPIRHRIKSRHRLFCEQLLPPVEFQAEHLLNFGTKGKQDDRRNKIGNTRKVLGILL